MKKDSITLRENPETHCFEEPENVQTMKLDGKGSVLTILKGEMNALFEIIFLAILIPVIGSLIVTNLNVTVDTAWGTFTGANIWAATGPIIGVVVTISVIMLLIKQFQKGRTSTRSRR